MVNHDDMLRSFTMANDDALPFSIDWARVMQDAHDATLDAYFNQSLPALSHGPTVPANLPPPPSKDISSGDDIRWVNCQLSTGGKNGCPRVYKLESVSSLSRISVLDILVTALFWSHVDALRTFLDLTRPKVSFLFHNWVGESGLWAENFRFCIKREGVEVTVCGLPCVLTVTDEGFQVGFVKENAVDDWVVGCVYTMGSRARKAWVRKGPVNGDISMEQSITNVKALLGVAPAYMCSISEP